MFVYEIFYECLICLEVFNESVVMNLNFGFFGINKILEIVLFLVLIFL